MIIKLQNGDKFKIESDEKREARKKFKEYSQLSIGQKLKRNLNITSNFLKSGPSITNFGNAISALFGGYSPENPDVITGDPPAVGIKNFGNLVRTARVAREFNDVINHGLVRAITQAPSKIKQIVNNTKQSRLISPGTYPLYRGPRFDINEIVNSDGTVNPRKAMQVQHTVAKQFGKGAHKMEHRLENPEWHKEDPNTYEHTKRVAQSAWNIPTPEGYTKQDQMIAALGHDFGKIVAGDGHAQIGADLAKQVFPNLTDAQYTAIAEHMGSPKTPLSKATKLADMRNGIVVRNINGKTRIQLPTHTDVKPREIVMDPQGNNKYYIHMRVWDDIDKHIPGNISNVEKNNLFQTLYETLPNGAEILFPKSGPGNYGTRGTVAGLQRLSKDPRFTPGTKGTLQYLDKDGKTIKTYEGTSFIKGAINDSKQNVFVQDEYGWKELSYPAYINHVQNNLKAKGIKTEPFDRSNTNQETLMNFFNKGFIPVFKLYPQNNLKAHAQEILRRMKNFGLDVDNTMEELPLYGKKSIRDLVTLNSGRTSYVGYYNKPGIKGTFFHNNGTSIVDPGYPQEGISPLQSIASTMHHERNMHGTQKFLTPEMWKPYEDLLKKMFPKTTTDEFGRTVVRTHDNLTIPVDKGSLKKEELRATIGELVKNIYDNQAYRRALNKNPNVKKYELETTRPYFEQVVDEMPDEQLRDILSTTNGYGTDYAEIGPKENPNFFDELRTLLKIAPASLPFLIPRKEEKK